MFEEIRWNETHLIGVKIDVGRVSSERLKELVELSWRYNASENPIDIG